jgi:hypothetical protein
MTITPFRSWHGVSIPLVICVPLVAPRLLVAQHATADTVLAVSGVTFGPARLGQNRVQARVKNVSGSRVLAVLDLRAVPGMWMIPNVETRSALALAPGEEGTLAGEVEFPRFSLEATLRVQVGPGKPLPNGLFLLHHIDFEHTYQVGRDNPDAYDPAKYFTVAHQGPFEIYAWKGSLAERRVDSIAAQRVAAMNAIATLLGVQPPARVRLVFYPDEKTKTEQTGHHGVGWAFGTTLVEVYNDTVQLDPYHELTHIIASAAGSPPAVFNEGFAIYATERLGGDALRFLGYRGKPVDEVVCGLAGTTDYISLQELLSLNDIGSRPARSGREYAEAGSFVRFLVTAQGVERFRQAYGALRDDAPTGENITRLREIYGETVPQLEADWRGGVQQACPHGG